jgi:type 1 glutamine amidotransferase
MFRPNSASLILLLLAALIAPLAFGAAADKDGFKPMLAGDSFDGWKKFGRTKWTVKDGVVAGGPGGGVLVYEESLEDYVFECDFKLAKGGNGGVYLRSRHKCTSQSPRYEIQIWDNVRGIGHRTGDLLYVHMARKWASKPTEWNTLRVTSVGPRHQVLLNGQLILDAMDFGKLHGCLAFQAHSSGKKPYIWYRNPRLRRLAKGKWPWPSKLPRVLVLMSKRSGPGKAHDRIGAAIENALAATGHYDVTWAADARALDPPHVDEYDVIVLHGPDDKNRSKWLNAQRRRRLAERVRAGRGLLVLHSSFTGRADDWPEFRELTGGAWRADNRGAASGPELIIRPLTQGHPIAAGVCPFQIHDTIRHVADRLAPGATAILCFEKDGVTHPVAWCAQHGKGRTFCCSLGSSEAAVNNPYYQLLLGNACDWVCPRPAAK